MTPAITSAFEAFGLSTGLVAIAEMGDKTQLLAMLLAARFRKTAPILWGILVATLLNHAAAGSLGAWVTSFVPETTLRWVLGAGFIVMGLWMLVPDKIDDDPSAKSVGGVFITTFIAFFLAEMGDKTQIATVGLAAHYAQHLFWVILGTTIGMMLANAPAVVIGERFASRLPLRWIRWSSTLLFIALGLLILWGSQDTLGLIKH
jgi:putative Ca2+/H+ antiporter (TMEM165/GDT1 family)